ncbi:MAG: transporter [Patescibacteria group bacterium]
MKKVFLNLFVFVLSLCFIFSASAASPKKDPNSIEQKIGEREEPAYQAFLRETTVILNPRQQSVDCSFGYNRNEINNVIVSTINREFSLITSYHLGLLCNIEAYLSIPLLWRKNTTQRQIEQTEDKNSNAGIGDISFGSKFILFQQKGSIPDIVGAVEVGLPTGRHPYSENPDDIGLGSGHWSGTFGLTAIKSCDPAVIYGGLNYTHIFKKDYNGQEIRPGEIIGYNFGTAFLINDQLTLGTQIIGSYQTEAKIDSEKVLFSSAEPIVIRNSLTYALSKNVSIEPSIIFGLNDDAPDVSFSFSYSRRF